MYVLIATKEGHAVIRAEDFSSTHDRAGGGGCNVYYRRPGDTFDGERRLESAWSAERVLQAVREAR